MVDRAVGDSREGKRLGVQECAPIAGLQVWWDIGRVGLDQPEHDQNSIDPSGGRLSAIAVRYGAAAQAAS